MKTHTSSKGPVLISFVLFIAILLGLFSIQMKSALDGFDRWVGHEDHRLPNIRLVPKSCRWAVIDRFIDLQPIDKADAFIFGDSQMFARGATQEEIFYTEWLGADATVINFSFLAASIADMRKIADDLQRRDVTVPTLVQNVNISHFIEERNLQKTELLPKRTTSSERVYKNHYLCAFRMRQSFSKDALRTPRYRKLLTKFSKVRLPDFFVNFDDEYFYDSVPQHLHSFENISDNPIFITAPMAYDKFELYGFDIKILDSFAVSFKELCKSYKNIDCRDLTRSITSEGFMDLIHMNAAGHKTLGKKLQQILPN